MRKIISILVLILISLQSQAQDTLRNKQDTVQKIEEVKVKGVRKRKIETEMKMAVSVD